MYNLYLKFRARLGASPYTWQDICIIVVLLSLTMGSLYLWLCMFDLERILKLTEATNADTHQAIITQLKEVKITEKIVGSLQDYRQAQREITLEVERSLGAVEIFRGLFAIATALGVALWFLRNL